MYRTLSSLLLEHRIGDINDVGASVCIRSTRPRTLDKLYLGAYQGTDIDPNFLASFSTVFLTTQRYEKLIKDYVK